MFTKLHRESFSESGNKLVAMIPFPLFYQPEGVIEHYLQKYFYFLSYSGHQTDFLRLKNHKM